MSSYIYDNRTLFIKCDCASVNEIRKSLNDSLTTYQSANNIDLKCRSRVNLVENREGKSFGIAFVFVTNPVVYHMLLGKNPDGSDRVEYRDDPSWTPPTKGDIVNDSGWATISAPVYTPGMSWADMDDIEYEHEQKLTAEKKKYVCPKIPVPLEPLMVLPPYELTPEQITQKRNKIIEDNSGKPGFDPKLVEIPSLAHLVVDRAMACPVDSRYMPNILKCQAVPHWVSKEDLKMNFSPYAIDSTTLQERFIKGRRVEETFPFVNINEDRVAFIIFDSCTNDALFALHMMKKTIIRKKMPDNSFNTTTLIFGHSYRTDRDLMTDISQQPRTVPRRDNTHRQYQNSNNQSRSARNNQREKYDTATKLAATPSVPRQQTEIHNKYSLLTKN